MSLNRTSVLGAAVLVARLTRPFFILAAIALALVSQGRSNIVAAQVRYTVDPKASLAWWQIAPHMRHLWATTCPQEPSWQPGDIYSIGFVPKFTVELTDTLVPLYPRFVAQSLCAQAIHGEVTVADTSKWAGVRGLITISVDSLVSGFKQRDDYARHRILETTTYPDVRFTIDSLASVRKTPKGDTLHANAVGVLELHGVKKPWVVPVKAWKEKLGLRVTGQFNFIPDALIQDYKMSPYPLNLGVRAHIWHRIYLGIDAILVGAPAQALGLSPQPIGDHPGSGLSMSAAP
jgi:hypothetical protein